MGYSRDSESERSLLEHYLSVMFQCSRWMEEECQRLILPTCDPFPVSLLPISDTNHYCRSYTRRSCLSRQFMRQPTAEITRRMQTRWPRNRDLIPDKRMCFSIQTVHRAHPVSQSMNNGKCFLDGKAAGAWNWPLPNWCRIREYMRLCFLLFLIRIQDTMLN